MTRKLSLVVAMAVAVTIAVAAVILLPSWEDQFFDIAISNNTDRVAEVRLCTNAECSRLQEPIRVSPDHRITARVSDERVLTKWEVFVGGQSEGCLSRSFSRKVSGLVLRISDATLAACKAP